MMMTQTNLHRRRHLRAFQPPFWVNTKKESEKGHRRGESRATCFLLYGLKTVRKVKATRLHRKKTGVLTYRVKKGNPERKKTEAKDISRPSFPFRSLPFSLLYAHERRFEGLWRCCKQQSCVCLCTGSMFKAWRNGS